MLEEMYEKMELSEDRNKKKKRTEMYLEYSTKKPMPFIRFAQEQLDEMCYENRLNE